MEHVFCVELNFETDGKIQQNLHLFLLFLDIISVVSDIRPIFPYSLKSSIYFILSSFTTMAHRIQSQGFLTENVIVQNTVSGIENENIRNGFENCVGQYDYILFEKGHKLYHSPSSRDAIETPFTNSGFYWDESSPNFTEGMWTYEVTVPFILPKMCQLNLLGKLEDRCSEFVDILGYSQVDDEYSAEYHYSRGETNIFVADGFFTACSGAKHPCSSQP